ncbi:rod-binding protein [Desulfobacter postgatei]|uniref:Rod binding protein n=1 Tax=Desulfobacter postgatei 2ac9 TaxID=879212 RepID=I5AZ93_9BACT|nr:rod-binding protein [Desulfobacter postgatei]EIM62556.1 Rod binding protein [Desulfobacter postgatei 2ac9]
MAIQMPGVMTPVTDTQDTTNTTRQIEREKDLEKACQGFEALMLNTLMQRMRDTLPGDSLFPESNASDVYQSLHDQFLTQNLSQGRRVTGFKEFLYQQLQDSV